MAILRAGLYERVSTDEQAKFGFSIGTQVEALNDYCEKNQVKVVDHYCDDGVSGGKAAFKRPEMSRLLEDVQQGKIDIILFTRLDRWFRNVPEYFKVQEILDRHGVQWKAIWEDYDTTTSNGRLAITIFLAIAQNEREKGSERVKVVFDKKIRNKEVIFTPQSMPFGYMRQADENGLYRLVKNPELSDALTDFWDLAIKYSNVWQAAKYVNETYNLNREIKLWNDVSKNEIYTGVYKGVEDYCEPYVDREAWISFRNRPKVKRPQCGRVHIFVGLIRCPQCGRLFGSGFKKDRLKDGTPVEYHYLKCKKGEAKVCGQRRVISEKKIEKYLLTNLESLMRDEIARVELEKTERKQKPKTNVSSLREKLRRLNVVYVAGGMSDAEYTTEVKEINEKIAKAEAETNADPGEKDLTGLKEMLEVDFRTIYMGLERKDKQRFWRSIIKEIKIDEESKIIGVVFL